jgi:hypothetical protein
MRHALLALTVLAACAGDEETSSTPQVVEQRTVHDLQNKTFTSDGVDYTLVRVEYGDTPECDIFDENCTYSTYCGFVVEDQDYPLEVHWVTAEDQLFDPLLYCDADEDIEDCELPGQTLPILEDEDFEDWMYETDPEDDVLVDCFADYW